MKDQAPPQPLRCDRIVYLVDVPDSSVVQSIEMLQCRKNGRPHTDVVVVSVHLEQARDPLHLALSA